MTVAFGVHTGFVGVGNERQIGATILPGDPTLPPPYDRYDLEAIKALRAGVASPDQQARALEWFAFAFGTYENPFRSDPYLTAFASGKQFAGQQIIKLINIRSNDLKQGT